MPVTNDQTSDGWRCKVQVDQANDDTGSISPDTNAQEKHFELIEITKKGRIHD